MCQSDGLLAAEVPQLLDDAYENYLATEQRYPWLLRCDMAFIEPMHRNEPNITYVLTLTAVLSDFLVTTKSKE